MLWIAAVTAVGLASGPAWADCPADKGRPRIFVKSKTPLRRGPGLNYQVSSFLESGKCMPFSEVSMDKRWVLVDAEETYGWVPMGRLDPKSQHVAQTQSPESSPVGSGQQRGKVRVVRQTILLDAPNKAASPKRVLPGELMVVPLSVTENGEWVEIVEERGQTGWVLTKEVRGDALANLPINEKPPGPPPGPAPSFDDGVVRYRPGRGGFGVAVTAAVFGGAFVPTHSLDSNAESGRRRYDLTALAPTTGLELEFMDLGPLSARVAYSTAFLTGIATEDDRAAGGNQHDLSVRAGLPLDLGPTTVTPEVGYSFGMFDFDSVLSDQPRNITFLSTTTHAATVGARVAWFPTRTLLVEAEAGGLFGATSSGPASLGDGGTTLGGYGSVGGQLFFGDFMGATLRYQVDYQRASYSGESQLDPTITEGTLSTFSHGLIAGLSFLLAG